MSKLQILFFLFFVSLSPSNVRADDSFNQQALQFKDVFLKTPEAAEDGLKRSFSKDSLAVWAGIISSTAILYKYDEDILSSTQAQGRRWGLVNNDNTKTFWKVGQYDILRLPTDAASGLYFLGDGWLHVWIAGGFVGAGKLADSTRAVNTGYELLNGMIVSTVFSQALKHAFGRQSPNQSTGKRGRWRPFPAISAYNSRTAEYDAMPSGHIMTTTLVFTVIRGNFPEYDHYLMPLEVVWVSALAFGMVNNGVHWVSDYPLGIAMGYVFGKASLDIAKPKSEQKPGESHSSFFPGVDQGVVTANWLHEF